MRPHDQKSILVSYINYIYSYITRTCTIKIISYMKETNTGVAKKEDEEE